MDYARPDAWDELATALRNQFVPKPAQECGHVECEPGWSWDPTMSDFDAWLVISGQGHASVGAERISLRPGTLVLMRPGDTGSFRQDPSDRISVVYSHFDFTAPDGGGVVAVPPDWLPSRHIAIEHPAQLSELMLRVVRMGRDPHPLRVAERSAVFFSVLAEIYRQDARAQGFPVDVMDPRLQDVVDYVRSHPGLRPTLTEAADIAGLSAPHLSRLFSRQLGSSFREFVLESRLERAHHLLTETSMTVGEVAKALGYHDLFLFSRQVRQRFGQPPSRLRGTAR